MIRILVVLLVALAFNSAIWAENGERLTSLKQLCISDKGTGFNWENGSWVSVNFVEKKFVVSKVNIPKEASILDLEADTETFFAFLGCNEDMFRISEEETGNVRMYRSCLKLQTLGEKNADYLACTEGHFKKEGGNDWNVRFNCQGTWESFYMMGGHFNLGYIHGNVSPDPENDYKDSLSIFVGKCVNIED